MTITGADFKKEVLDANGLVVVDFFATWCGPCRALTPILESVSNDYGIKVCKVDVDKEEELASLFNVRSIPMLVVFKDGKVVDSHLGLLSRDDLIQFLGL